MHLAQGSFVLQIAKVPNTHHANLTKKQTANHCDSTIMLWSLMTRITETINREWHMHAYTE
jgi:hypothetical protein